MYSLHHAIAIVFLVFVSVSCNNSEVTASYKNGQADSAISQSAADATGTAGAPDKNLETAALAIIQKSCVKCHAGGAASGGFGNIDDVAAMIASNKYIIPGNPDGSAIYKRIAVAKSMPPAGPLPDTDADTIKQWISGLQ